MYANKRIRFSVNGSLLVSILFVFDQKMRNLQFHLLWNEILSSFYYVILMAIVAGLFLVFHVTAVKSLNVKSLPYSIINMEEDNESLLKLSENAEKTKEEINPQVSRRGYAGEDFYQKAAKNIPRMGRRGLPSNDVPLTDSEEFSKVKRPYMQVRKISNRSKPQREKLILFSFQQVPEEAWPWDLDRVPTHIKRKEIVDHCNYWPKIEKFVNDAEFCNENFMCCSALKDSSILKRFLQTYPSKQTAQKPDYKNNQYMK